jgi:hypothetical protein
MKTNVNRKPIEIPMLKTKVYTEAYVKRSFSGRTVRNPEIDAS